MSTENLHLELIEGTDTLRTEFINKINGNLDKIDAKYGVLKDGLLEKTGKDNLVEAVDYVSSLENTEDATVIASDVKSGKIAYGSSGRITGTGFATSTTANASNIMSGKTAYKQDGTLLTGTGFATQTTATSNDIIASKTAYTNEGTLITGVASREKTLNVELTGSNATYKGYISGYGAGINQDGTLVIWAMSNSTSYEHVSYTAGDLVGTAGSGFGITSYDTSDPVSVPHACTVTGLTNYDVINVELNVTGVNGTYDYVAITINITAE